MTQQLKATTRTVNLYEIPQIQFYKKTHQPMMSEQNKRIIKEKLNLQKQSIRNTRQRQRVGDLFFNYRRNPFTDFSYRVPTAQVQKDQERREQLEKNLINEIYKNRQNRILKPAFLDKINEVNHVLLNAQLLSKKLVSTVSANQKQLKHQQNNNRKEDVEEEKTQSKQTDIDSILKIKDQNFFLKKSKSINIFSYGLGQPFDSVQKQLQKRYFSFVSVIQKIQKIKIPIFRDISRMGRRVILGLSTGKDNVIDYVDSYELSFKTNQLLFHDMMSVASGRFSSQFVYKAINFEGQSYVNKQASDISSGLQVTTTFYREDQQNQQCKFTNGNEQAQQIVDYLKLQLNQQESKYDLKCVRKLEKIHQIIQAQQKLVLLTISDRQIHKGLQNQVIQRIEQFINMDKKAVDDDRNIRNNKRHKQKEESIKLQRLQQTLQLINQHSRKMGKKYQEIKYPRHGLRDIEK